MLVPPRCLACAGATTAAELLCGRCGAALAGGPTGVSALVVGARRLEVRWACEYSGVARDLVRALKFAGRLSAAMPIAAAMAPLTVPATVLVPVPPAPWRRRMRGFDPAEEIAVALGRAAELEVVPCLRRRGGRRQVGRSRADRLADPPRVRRAGPAPAAAVLVDDVFTTGSTLAACARALDGRAVAACVFARAGCTRA